MMLDRGDQLPPGGEVAEQRETPTGPAKPGRSFLVVNPERQFGIVRGLASPVRIRILRLLRRQGPMNVNQIAEALALPQSTIASNVQILEDTELINTEVGKATKGQQKICSARFDEIVVRLDTVDPSREKNVVEVEMPLNKGPHPLLIRHTRQATAGIINRTPRKAGNKSNQTMRMTTTAIARH
jgi:predicted transcriptional regulator